MRDILAEQVPAYQAWAFGSRVRGTAQKFSDLDICLRAELPMGLANLPFVVDIVDLNRCSAAFAQSIDQARVSLN